MKQRWAAVLLAVALASSLATLPAYADAGSHTLSVGGDVLTPASYSLAQLEALPQTSAAVTARGRQVTDTGVLLETLVTTAQPAYPSSLLNTKNELLRVTASVRGSGHQDVTFAVGELDPNFGNHPALLALSQDGRPLDDGPELVVPGDRLPIRSVPHVSEVTVGIATAPATSTNPAPGSPLEVIHDGHTRTLSTTLLGKLPSETLSVSFEGPGGEQTHTEVGPPLWEVLLVAGVVPTLNTWVAAVGSDNYVATVTPAEQFVGGRPLQLALAQDGLGLAQPRLVADGDLKGGRYVSDVVDLYAGAGPAH